MCPDTHHKYLGVIPITFEDIANRDRPFFIRPHSSHLHHFASQNDDFESSNLMKKLFLIEKSIFHFLFGNHPRYILDVLQPYKRLIGVLKHF